MFKIDMHFGSQRELYTAPHLFVSFPDWKLVFGATPEKNVTITTGRTPPGEPYVALPLPEGEQYTPAAFAVKMKGMPHVGDRRTVYQFIGPDCGLSLRLGLTVHAARGAWSSTPHKFEKEALLHMRPPYFSEQFAYLTSPPGGWGLQARSGWTTNGNCPFGRDVVIIAGKTVCNIPLGLHPVVAAPGYKLAYFWAYTAANLEAIEKFAPGNKTYTNGEL